MDSVSLSQYRASIGMFSPTAARLSGRIVVSSRQDLLPFLILFFHGGKFLHAALLVYFVEQPGGVRGGDDVHLHSSVTVNPGSN